MLFHNQKCSCVKTVHCAFKQLNWWIVKADFRTYVKPVLPTQNKRYVLWIKMRSWGHLIMPAIGMMTSSNGKHFRVTCPLCGNSPVTGELPAQRPVTRSFDVFFNLRLNKRLSKHSWGWWFETPSRPLWRHNNVWLTLRSWVTELSKDNKYVESCQQRLQKADKCHALYQQNTIL